MNDVMIDVAAQAAQIVGTESLLPDAERQQFAVDGLIPAAVVCPDSVEAVSRLLAFANENGLAVIPWGGGTQMALGGAPTGVAIVLSTQRLGRVIDYAPDDLTVTVQAGVTMAQIQALLAGHGQMLALDPPLPEKATAGGILATNASGPLRYQFGMPRDVCLGTTVVYADGTVAKAGGRTVKNVAGFDMTRLHIGACGTLGVIIEATFKVWPVPKRMITVTGSFDSLAAALAAAKSLRMARIAPWSLAVTPPGLAQGKGYGVAVRLAGPDAVVEPQAKRARETLGAAQASNNSEVAGAEESLWPAIRDWPATAGSAGSVMVRLGIAPSHTAGIMDGLQSVAERNGLRVTMLAYPGAATIYCLLGEATDKAAAAVAAMVALVKEWNGNLVIERCPAAFKQQAPVWGGAEADDLTRRVKTTFDPKSTLNPGRFVGGI